MGNVQQVGHGGADEAQAIVRGARTGHQEVEPHVPRGRGQGPSYAKGVHLGEQGVPEPVGAVGTGRQGSAQGFILALVSRRDGGETGARKQVPDSAGQAQGIALVRAEHFFFEGGSRGPPPAA